MVKGLLKGLRYISHVFGESEEEADEMRIGFPTNVKHVAHIGCNGLAANVPSWMKEFNQANGGIESDTLVAFTHSIKGIISSPKESVGSSSLSMIKINPKLDTKQIESRRRKDSHNKPIRKKANASNTQLTSEESNDKPKRIRRRKKNVIKKVTDEDSLRSSDTSSKIPSAPSTDESGNLDRSECESIYGSALKLSDEEGSTESYGTITSHL